MLICPIMKPSLKRSLARAMRLLARAVFETHAAGFRDLARAASRIYYAAFFRSTPLGGLNWLDVPVSADDPADAVAWQDVTLEEVTLRSLVMQPPSVVQYRMVIPGGGRFRSFVGLRSLGARFPHASGRALPVVIRFALNVRSAGGGRTGRWTRTVNSVHPGSHDQWIAFNADLSRFGEELVTLSLSLTLLNRGHEAPSDPRPTFTGVCKALATTAWASPAVKSPRRWRDLYFLVLHEFRINGPSALAREAISKARRNLSARLDDPRPNIPEELSFRRHDGIERRASLPLISILMPVHDPIPYLLHRTIQSLLNQHYTNWELSAVNSSTDPRKAEILNRYAALDPRVKVRHDSEKKGLAEASNEAMAMATGEYVAVIGHEDELHPGALEAVVVMLATCPEADWVYTDEAVVRFDGSVAFEAVKPDWSPELLLSLMYTRRMSVYRTAIVRDSGAFRPGFNGAEDYDLALRVSERTNRIQHVPKALYYWRDAAGSTPHATSLNADAIEASARAVVDFVRRNSMRASREHASVVGCHRIRHEIEGQPLVSIVIPSAGRSRQIRSRQQSLVGNCVRSIIERCDYPHFEVLVVDNGDLPISVVGELEEGAARLSSLPGCRSLRRITFAQTAGRAFNLPAKMNFGVASAKGSHLLLLNDDIEVLSSEWLTSMLEFSQNAKIGAVGAKLYFPNGAIQHAGVFLSNGLPCHLHYGVAPGRQAVLPELSLIRNCSAVTGACMMTRAELYEQVGGFDEAFPINFNDVDYCLKVRSRGYRVVFTPYAELVHYESISRTPGVKPEESCAFCEKWGPAANDPYYYPGRNPGPEVEQKSLFPYAAACRLRLQPSP